MYVFSLFRLQPWLAADIREGQGSEMRQFMRLWYLSHRRPARAQASLRRYPRSLARAFAVHTHEMWKQTKGPAKNQTSAPLDGCA